MRYRFRVHIARQSLLGSVNPHVDDHRVLTHHVAGDESSAADGRDQDVGLPRLLRQVARLAVADGHGGVGHFRTQGRILRLQQHRQRFADNITATNNHHMFPRNRDPLAMQHLEYTVGSARQESRAALRQQPDIFRMECVDVLERMDGIQNARGLDRFRQRELNQDSVDIVLTIQTSDQFE